MTAASVEVGDTVKFVNQGKVIDAVVKNVHLSGHADLEYPDPPWPKVQANGIPPANGGDYGYEKAVKAAPAPLAKDADQA